MSPRILRWMLAALAVAAVLAAIGWPAREQTPPVPQPPSARVESTRADQPRGDAAARDAPAARIGEIAFSQLPPQARETLALIRNGGPFPYEKDGTTFRNREGLLPKRPRGYYTEYTVRTPGERDRGARRIVAGSPPATSGEYYYTDDHYRSFRRIRE